MYCRKCGAHNREDAQFCTKCGAHFEAKDQNQSSEYTAASTQTDRPTEPTNQHNANSVTKSHGKRKGWFIGIGVAAAVIAVFAIVYFGNNAAPSDPVAMVKGQVIPKPTLEPPPEATLQTLKEEDVSLEVSRLQERLAALGYLDFAPDEMTETYGPKTKQAVERFQRQNGLEVNGQADELTLTAIYAADAPSYEPQQLPLSGITIGLDPRHQAHGNSEHEPVAPGSSDTKPKVSSGTSGVSTHVDESIVNLAVGLRLRDILQNLGANVLMTRDTNDVNISNAERAHMMNNAGVDLVVRLHCDGEDDQSLNGAFILIPSGSYTTDIQSQSRSAAEAVLSAFIAETGANSLGLSERDDQTGFNWSTVPIIDIEMGHMSNPAEDQRLVTEEYQQQCAQGIANGLVNYFS